MWKQGVESTQKLDAPADIEKIIKEVPPVVIPIKDSYRRILEVDYYGDSNSIPLVPDLNVQLKQILKNISDNSRNNSKNNTLANNKNENAELI